MIRLSRDDADFLVAVLELPSALRQKLSDKGRQEISVSSDEANVLRDLCGERLQTHGFDKEYNPTEEGKRLENLVDKLFTG